MGLLKTGLKVVGSVALCAGGITSKVLRQCACATDKYEAADTLGNLEDKCFETIRDMWTPQEKRDETYYEKQNERSMERYESAMREGEKLRQQLEHKKEHT